MTTSTYEFRKKYKTLIDIIKTDSQLLRKIYKRTVDQAFENEVISDTEREVFYEEIDNGIYDQSDGVIYFIRNLGVWYSSIGEVITMLKEAKTQEERKVQWFVYDAAENEFELYGSKEEAWEAFVKILGQYHENAVEGELDSNVERLCMGKVTHEVVLVPIAPDALANLVECGFAKEGDEIYEAAINEIGE